MKKAKQLLGSTLPSIATFCLGIVVFPKVDNQHLLQSKINTVSIYVLFILAGFAVSYLLRKTILTTFRKKIAIGLVSLALGLAGLFIFYYPYANRNILRLKVECGGNFVRGYQLNHQRLNMSDSASLDSLSQYNPEELVLSTNCQPEVAWTPSSIESVFNKLFYIAASVVFLLAVGIDLLIKALTATR